MSDAKFPLVRDVEGVDWYEGSKSGNRTQGHDDQTAQVGCIVSDGRASLEGAVMGEERA